MTARQTATREQHDRRERETRRHPRRSRLPAVETTTQPHRRLADLCCRAVTRASHFAVSELFRPADPGTDRPRGRIRARSRSRWATVPTTERRWSGPADASPNSAAGVETAMSFAQYWECCI